ncbi:MAG: HAD family hydrolase [Coprothermobacterota bacterium]|nr:HAD family hydrolase [Coprothermobacterota bacterium]
MSKTVYSSRIRWVFLDVGNVLFNDDPLMAVVYSRMWEAIRRRRPGFSFSSLMAERERLIETWEYKHYSILARRYLSEEEWASLHLQILEGVRDRFEGLNQPIPASLEVVRSLSRRYKLGVAANQMASCRPLLVKRGLLPYFRAILISEEIGLAKPDPRFFERLLRVAACAPERVVMVGDRIDNDIIPAKRMGLRTIWLQLDPVNKGYQPEDAQARLYLESLQRGSLSLVPPRSTQEQPDQTIHSLSDLPSALEALSGSVAGSTPG